MIKEEKYGNFKNNENIEGLPKQINWYIDKIDLKLYISILKKQ